MKIIYQGRETETPAVGVAAFLEGKGITPCDAVVELDGEILQPETAATAVLREGAVLNAFRIVAGG